MNQANLFDQPAMRSPIDIEKERVMIEAKDKGCDCPVCGQFVKVYKRKISSIHAKQLLLAHKKHGREWFHIREMDYFTTDWAVLQHFGLIIPKPHKPDEKKASGYWRITKDGGLFCERIETVHSHVVIYNNARLGFDGDPVTIQQCLGEKFDYMELMA